MHIQKDFNNELEKIQKDLDRLIAGASYGQLQLLVKFGLDVSQKAISYKQQSIKELGKVVKGN